MINKDECPGYLNEYLFYMKVIKGRAERSVEAYYTDLRVFLRFLRLKNESIDEKDFDNLSIRDVPIEYIKKFTLNDAIEFLYYTSDKRHNSPATRARKASALKSFFKYLAKNTDYIEKDPVKDLEMPSLKKALPKYLTLEQSLDMLSNISADDPMALRDFCILTLFLNCGMRLSELVGLNINDINLTEQTMRLLGKGNKERIIYMNNACIDAIQKYRATVIQPQGENALFLSKQHKRISKRRVQQIIENALKTVGLDGQGLSTHKLRHTAATLMYQHGNVDTLVLKEILGHKSIVTTEIYTHISNENLKNAAGSSPLANVKKITKPKNSDNE